MKTKRIVCMLIAFVMAFSVAAVVTTIDTYAASHTHTYGAWKVTKKATCKKTGQKQRKCKKCKKVQKKTIPKTAHKYGAWKTTKKATCKAAGKKQRTCKTCKAKQTATIAKTAHSYGAWKTTKSATCKAAGQKQRTCKTCKAVEKQTIAKLDHKYGEWKVTKAATCTANGEEQRTCSLCKAVEKRTIAKIAHKYGEWKVTKAATCTANGEEQRTCSMCKAAEKRTIAKKGHSYGEWATTKEPTCVEKGVQQRTCATCKAVESKTIAATGKHNWASEPTTDWSPTCTASGRESIHCLNKNCTAVKDIEYIDPTGHDYAGQQARNSLSVFRMAPSPVAGKTVVINKDTDAKGHVLAKVCVKCNNHTPLPKEEHQFSEKITVEPKHNKDVKTSTPGKKTYTCDICGYSYSETIEALPHDLVTTKEVKATCTARGQEYSECTVCGQEFFKYTDMPLGHKWGEPTIDKPATCTEKGRQSVHCENEGCNAVKESVEIPDLGGHKWGDWQTTTKPTCTAKGVDTRTCDVCGATETKATNSLGGHKYAEGEPEVIKEATCTENGVKGRRCTNEGCESIADQTTIPKKGHTWNEQITVEPTCTEPGSMTRTCDVCGTVEKEVDIPAGGGSHNWSSVEPTESKSGDSCTPVIEYMQCKNCNVREYVTVGAGSGHNWVKTTNTKEQECMVCSKCGKYQPGWGKLPKAGTSTELDENGQLMLTDDDYTDVSRSYRCVWIAYFTTDMNKSEGFNNHRGIKCDSIGETRIVGGSSGYEDNQFTTVSMKAPAARSGYEFVGWKLTGASDGELLSGTANDGRYQVKGDTLILNWRADDMSFTPVYKVAGEKSQPAEISMPENTQLPEVTVPGTDVTVPTDEVTVPTEDMDGQGTPAVKPEDGADDALVTDDAA